MPKIQKTIRESLIQREVVQYAKSKGWMVFKFDDRAAPDRIFFGPGDTFLIEFKRHGKKPRADQAFTIKELRSTGASVFVVDNIERGKQIVDDKTRREACTT